MINPRNLMAQQDLISVTTSQSTTAPASAYAAYLLQQQINAISNNGFPINSVCAADESVVIVGLPNAGTLKWDGVNNQPVFEIANSDITHVGIFNNTTDVTGAVYQDVADYGSFAITTFTDYYFSSDGAVNTTFNLADPTTRMKIDAFFQGGTDVPTYTLNLTVMRSPTNSGNVISLIGNVYAHDIITLKQGFTYRWEGFGSFNPDNSQPFKGAWGDSEAGVGVVAPAEILLTSYSVYFDNLNPSYDVTLYLTLNGTAVAGSEMTIPASTGIITGTFTIPPTYQKGDSLSVRSATINTDNALWFCDVVLYGTLIGSE